MSDRPADAQASRCRRSNAAATTKGVSYDWVDVALDARRSHRDDDRDAAPAAATPPRDLAGILGAGAGWWPLAMARELDDAILLLRANKLESGRWC